MNSAQRVLTSITLVAAALLTHFVLCEWRVRAPRAGAMLCTREKFSFKDIEDKKLGQLGERLKAEACNVGKFTDDYSLNESFVFSPDHGDGPLPHVDPEALRITLRSGLFAKDGVGIATAALAGIALPVVLLGGAVMLLSASRRPKLLEPVNNVSETGLPALDVTADRLKELSLQSGH